METSSLYRKIQAYLKLLWQETRKSLGEIENIGWLPCDYKTDNRLPQAEEFVRYDTNGTWGSGWDSHAWFRLCTEAHTEQNGTPLILKICSDRTGWDPDKPQFLIYVDGEMRQGMDTNHTELLLDSKNQHEIYVYAYTGPKIAQCRFYAELFSYRPDVEKLWYDIKVPLDSLSYLEEYSNEYQSILKHLDQAVSLLNVYEVPSQAFDRSIDSASRYMDEEFYGAFCGQRPDAPKTVCIGHTHIDCAWLWTLRQTREKVQRSFSTVVELMNRYPEYKFMSSQALLYKDLKEEAPKMYEQVKRLIKEGRWECEGSIWVEADCNLSSGESLIRQVLYGKRFFKQEFGAENRVLWLPDVFGYSAALPQILRKSGIDWFVTSKISWNDTNQMPYDTFDWQGIDGTRIHSYFLTAQDKKRGEKPERYTTYVGHTTPAMVAGTFERYQQKNLNNEALLTFGFGDGGGGPTAEHLEMARRLSYGVPGTPKTEIRFVGDFLSRLEKKIENDPRLPVWQGELYLEYHRGTYTAVHKNKKNNRRSEFLYMNTELLCCLEKLLFSTPFPKKELHQGWEMLLTNQFHDIIPGSSIQEVYDRSDIDYEIIKSIAEPKLKAAQNAIASGIARSNGYVVFNPNPFEGKGIVRTDDGACAYVEGIPAKGYACVKEPKTDNRIAVSSHSLENQFFKLIFDEHMTLSSIYDKRACREVLKRGRSGNELRVYADHPDKFDAWEWTEYSLDQYTVITDVQNSEIVQDGVRAGIRITRRHMASTVTQTVWLYDDIDRIDFETDADWHQKHQMLKAAFDVDVNSDRATYEIQYGTVERPTHKNTSWDAMRFEVCAHKFADLSEGNYGVSLLNDCKYGYDIHDSVMTLSLLRSPTYPDPDADQGHMICVYALCPHEGALCVPHISAMAYELNNPMQLMPAAGERSVVPECFSAVQCSKENILCEVLKEAEDSEDIVLRFYESRNTKTVAEIQFGFDIVSASLCDMLENELECIPIKDNAISLTFGAFEIHTLKVRPKTKHP